MEKLFKNYLWQEPVDETVADETNSTEGAASTVQSPPRMLWSTYFNIPSCLKCQYADETPIPGLHLACGPHLELDYDKCIADVSCGYVLGV